MSFQKTQICSTCPLRNAPFLQGERYPQGKTPQDEIQLLILGSAPDMASIGDGRAFTSIAEALVRRMVQDVLWPNNVHVSDRVRFDVDYAIPCGFVGALPTVVERTCQPNLEYKISRTKPPVILALGKTAAKMLGLRVNKLSEIRGKTKEINLRGHRCVVLPTFEPYQVRANPGLFRTFRIDLEHAVEVASRTFQAEKPQPTIEDLTREYVLPQTVEEVAALCELIIGYAPGGRPPEKHPIVLDIETTSLNTWDPDFRIIAIAFAWDVGRAATIMLDHKATPYPWEEAWAHVCRVLDCPKPKVNHNLPFDLAGIEHAYGQKVRNVRWDTLFAEHILDENKKGHYGLKMLTPTYCLNYSGYEDVLWDQLAAHAEKLARDRFQEEEEKIQALGAKKGIFLSEQTLAKPSKGKTKTKAEKKATRVKKSVQSQLKAGTLTFEDVDPKQLGVYAGVDADVTRQIFTHQNGMFQKHPAYYKVLADHYLPGLRVISEIQHHGTRVDLAYLQRMEDAMDVELGHLQERMFELAGKEFNPNSKAQLQEVIRKRLDLPALEWTDTGQMATGKQVVARYLKELPEGSPGHQFMSTYARFKLIHKGRTGFLKAIRALVDHRGFLHGYYHLNGTETGRLSSSQPNMQNWASYIGRVMQGNVVVEPGYNLKKLLIPSTPDYVFFNMDYSGAELRVFTAYSHDQMFIDALHKGLDLHSLITSLVAHVPYEEVQPPGKAPRPAALEKLRTRVKRVVFGTLYGGGVGTMANILSIPIPEAQEIVDQIFVAVPTLPQYIAQTTWEVDTQGYVETFFGRRRHFELSRMDRSALHECYREAANFEIQSTSSEITFGQLIEIHRELKKVGGRVLGTVHDSIFGEVPRAFLPELGKFLAYWATERVAQKYPWMPVPFAHDLEVGPSYGELSKLEA